MDFKFDVAGNFTEGVGSGPKTQKDGEVSGMGRVYGVKDDTAISFAGLLLNFSILNEGKQSSQSPAQQNTARWRVEIEAEVLDKMPDRFAGRQAVVLPSLDRIVKSLSVDNAGPKLVQEVAQELKRGLESTFANHPQFVLLERNSEDVLDKEAARAGGGNAATREESKLGGQKVADIVVELESEPLSVKVDTTNFDLGAPSLQKVQIVVRGSIRLLDMSTRGEICRVPFEAGNKKPVSSAGDVEPAVAKAAGEFRTTLADSMRRARIGLLGHLGVAKLLSDGAGGWRLVGGLDSQLIKSGDRVTLLREEGQGKWEPFSDTTVSQSGMTVTFSKKMEEVKSGQVVSFRIEAPIEEAAPAAAAEPKGPSLKDRLKFD